ncbi:MAG: MFS transporter [Candidatus Methylomirabilia bacterium]
MPQGSDLVPISFVLRGFYFLSFFGLGVYAPYLSLFLWSRGLTGAEVGAVWALLPLGAVVAPPLWGIVADKFRNRRILIFSLTAAAGGMFAGLLFAKSVLLLATVVFLFSAFRTSTLPLVESATFEHLAGSERDAQGKRPAYGGFRLWGSVGFIIASLSIGYLVDAFSIRAMVYVFLAGAGLQALLALTLPSEAAGPRVRLGREIVALLRKPGFSPFLAAGFVLRTSHGPFWTFLPVHMKALGLSGAVIGWSFSVGVVAEAIFLMFSRPILERVGTRMLLMTAAGASALRWWLYTLAGEPGTFLAISLLHALTFAAFHVAGVSFVDRNTAPTLKSSGQAFFSAATYGAGGIAGAGLSGILLDALGIEGLFRAAAVVALLSGLTFGMALQER